MALVTSLRRFVGSVRADFGSVQRYREKYHHQRVSLGQLPVAAVTKVGFQMLIATRLMALGRDTGVPLAPRLTSRLIRHLYGAEIHWDTEIADGVSIVHGNGLVLSHRARVGPGCILFHNVTLGEALHPDTRESGAPTLGRDVHVGPGATLLGPITVGDGSKIAAGVVLTRSVPPGSVVLPPEPVVMARGGGNRAAPPALE